MRAAAIITALLLAAAATASAQQYRAFWADAFHSGYKSPAEVDQMLDDCGRARCNAIFVQARRRADSYYVRTLEVPAQDSTYSPSFDALAYLIERAHARGVEVHAWFVVYPVWPTTIAPPTNPDHVWHKHGPRAQGEDMWMSVSSAGLLSSAFDPGHPAVQRYLAEVITDPVSHYDLDGVHLDYIRYIEDAPYGWNPKAIERFQRLENRDAAPAANDATWSDFRRRQVTQLVRQIYLRTIEKKPQVKVSAALISWGNGPLNDAGWRSTDAFATVFQDWRAWMEEGILDLAMPMHYFAEARNAAFLDRWLAFAKDRQYGRRYLPGLAPYLNSIPESLAQVRRALTPSPAGGEPLGVALYSYASTNTLNAAGNPVVENGQFYSAFGDLFGEAAPVPELPWKKAPTTGHVMGWLRVDGGPDWLADGAVVRISSDTGRPFQRTVEVDGTGFFGAVDLPPDRYWLTFERGGRLLQRIAPRDLRAGQVMRVEERLKAEDFEGVLPRLFPLGRAAAPGDVIELRGTRLSVPGSVGATAVPLPRALLRTQVLINGVAAPLFSVGEDRVLLQLPYAPGPYEVIARHWGLESNTLRVEGVAARPVIVGVRRSGRVLEIYATGLGAVRPSIGAGLGAPPESGLPVVAGEVRVLVGADVREPLWAGLVAYYPGRYQVNVELPEGVESGEVRLSVGGTVSDAARW